MHTIEVGALPFLQNAICDGFRVQRGSAETVSCSVDILILSVTAPEAPMDVVKVVS
jgi:hypothetical protein